MEEKKSHVQNHTNWDSKNLESKWLHKENKIIIYVIWP